MTIISAARGNVLVDVADERMRQDDKWGIQDHSDGTDASFNTQRDVYRRLCEDAFSVGKGTWRHILSEEVYEAYAESDVVKLRAELVQVCAVSAAWIEAIDRRAQPEEAQI
jgi:hypothetical protein